MRRTGVKFIPAIVAVLITTALSSCITVYSWPPSQPPQQPPSGSTTFVPSDIPPFEAFDACKDANPHATYSVPPVEYFNPPVVRVSGSGFYHYQADKNAGCDRWILWVTMHKDSNCNTDPNSAVPAPCAVVIEADVYDLPSSSTFGGEIPMTEEDCERLHVYIDYYQWKSGEPGFTKMKGTIRGGNWAGGQCHMAVASTIEVPNFNGNVGWDIYMVAVWAQLRGSAQEVQVKLYNPGPN